MEANTNELKRFEELLDKFFKETPHEEIKKMLEKYDKMMFEGPTLSEYFRSMDGERSFQELQNEVKKWSDAAFGIYRTGKPIAHHLKKEINELIDALEEYHQGTYNGDLDIGIQFVVQRRERILYEAVDCFTLLIDVLAHEHFDMNDLRTASFTKLEINKKRKWGKPDENGVIEHIKE